MVLNKSFLLYRNLKVVNLTTALTLSEVFQTIILPGLKQLYFNEYYSNYWPQVLVWDRSCVLELH